MDPLRHGCLSAHLFDFLHIPIYNVHLLQIFTVIDAVKQLSWNISDFFNLGFPSPTLAPNDLVTPVRWMSRSR